MHTIKKRQGIIAPTTPTGCPPYGGIRPAERGRLCDFLFYKLPVDNNLFGVETEHLVVEDFEDGGLQSPDAKMLFAGIGSDGLCPLVGEAELDVALIEVIDIKVDRHSSR